MQWYYAVDSERRGPVSEGEFSRLIETGEIQPATLVWHEGMEAWIPWREAQADAPSPAAVCSQCGGMVPEDELIDVDGRRVCAACKPEYLQRVREGVAPEPHDQMLGDKLLTLPEVVKLSWTVWTGNFWVILALTLLTAIPANLILESAAPTGELNARELGRYLRLTMFLQLILGSFSAMGIAHILEESLAGRRGTFGGAIKHAFSRWMAAIGTGFIENVIVAFLLLLLIVPGIIWLGYYTFTAYVVALRHLAGKCALDYSKELVRGRWWHVVGFALALMVLTLVPAIAFGAAVESQDNAALSVATSIATDVLASFMFVALGVLFVNLDSLKQAGRLP